MSAVVYILVVAVIAAFLFFAFRKRGAQPGPENNWTNEEYMARGADGTWSDGNLRSGDNSAPNNVVTGGRE